MIRKRNTNNRIPLETIQIIIGILIILFPLLSPADTIFLENGMRLDVEKAWEEAFKELKERIREGIKI